MSATAKRSKVPNALATPTDLDAQGAQRVAEALNPIVADSLALYVKTKNFHWHLSGQRFRDLHLLFDEHAEAIFESIDLLAERVRKLGGTTIRSISHVAELQTIADDNDDLVPAQEMVRRLCEDNRHVAEQMRAAHEVCDGAGDVGTASILENLIDEAERRTWFLFEIGQD